MIGTQYTYTGGLQENNKYEALRLDSRDSWLLDGSRSSSKSLSLEGFFKPSI